MLSARRSTLRCCPSSAQPGPETNMSAVVDCVFLPQVKEHIDVFLTHDWPRGIHAFGDERGLIRKKPHFQASS